MKRLHVALVIVMCLVLPLCACGPGQADKTPQILREATPMGEPTQPAEESPSESGQTPGEAGQGGGLAVTEITRAENNELEEKSAVYPQTGIESIDDEALSIVDTAFAEPVGDASAVVDAKGTILIDYAIARNDDVLFSVVYSVYAYYAGAAHGTTAIIAKNYAMPGGEPVLIEDLFSNDDFVTRLSTLSEEKLRSLQIDMPEDTSDLSNDSWFFDGVSPDVENFRQFLPLDHGLQFIFSNYQVAPYVVGEVRLTLPWEEIEDIMAQKWVERLVLPQA